MAWMTAGSPSGVEDDDLQEAAGTVGAEDEQPVVILADLPYRNGDGMQDVEVRDPVFPGAVRDLHAT